MFLIVLILMVTTTGVAVGVGAGGGGGRSAAIATLPATDPALWKITDAEANVYRTDEYKAQWGLEAINSAEAIVQQNLVSPPNIFSFLLPKPLAKQLVNLS